ncbi:MAG: hypothetical protein IH975_09645 [Nitrospinae bacterium]|nr:hypothetical protein [Nitrospinota bacterium]
MTPVAERLTAIRNEFQQQHSLVAQHMLNTLIADVEREAELQRIVNTPARRRTNGRKPADCRFGLKYGKSGATRNRKHQCGPECGWTGQEALAWLGRTPYRIAPGVEIMSQLVPVPPCVNCDRTRSDHWEPAADPATGRLTGYRAIKECEYTPVKGS